MVYKGHYINGRRVPSVTTIAKITTPPDGLVYSAVALTREGKNYKEEWGRAADCGSLAHKMIRAKHHAGDPIDFRGYPDDVIAAAYEAYNNYEDWASLNKLQVVASEVNLVSKKYSFGGTLDAITLQDELGLADWKTGKIYVQHLYQLGGYALLWEENYPDDALSSFHLMMFSKLTEDVWGDTGGFMHRSWRTINKAKEGFLKLREIYELEKAMLKMI